MTTTTTTNTTGLRNNDSTTPATASTVQRSSSTTATAAFQLPAPTWSLYDLLKVEAPQEEEEEEEEEELMSDEELNQLSHLALIHIAPQERLKYRRDLTDFLRLANGIASQEETSFSDAQAMYDWPRWGLEYDPANAYRTLRFEAEEHEAEQLDILPGNGTPQLQKVNDDYCYHVPPATAES